MHELRKKLIRNKELNPFSDTYNQSVVIAEVESYIKNNSETDEAVGLIQTLLTTVHLNQHYIDSYSYLKDNLFKCNLTVEEIISYSISSFNRQYLIIGEQLLENFNKQQEITYDFAHGHKISSFDTSIGEIDAVRALEGVIDALNLLCTYVRYFEDEIPPKIKGFDEINSIESIKRLNMVSNFIDVLKSEYDKCIWNEGFCEIDNSLKRIDFRFFNQSNLILKKLGFFRLQKNVASFNHVMKERIDNSEKFAQIIREHYRKNKKPNRIKLATIESGYVKYKLASGEDKREFEEELSIDNEFLTYYNFIVETKMPQLDKLSLKDLIKLFSVTQQLIRKVSNNKVEDDSIFKLDEFGKFAYKIKTTELQSYLLLRTTYSIKQISQFLDLMTCPKDKRVNFWNYPLIKIGLDYLFPILTIASPITTVLADRWLEDGGFNIDERGKMFEKYIIETISEILKMKEYDFKIPKKDTLKNLKGAKEEIDLILNLKTVCLIAEVKCIKFALNAIDEHNAIKRLQKGAEQAVRKAKFIEDNSEDFLDEIGDIKGKKIIKVVVTNYPIYSGFILNEVPVIDFFMLESYIHSGMISHQKQVIEKGKYKSREIVSETKLYNDEDEFCSNLYDFLQKPKHIYDNWNMFKSTVNKITPEFMDWGIYVEAADAV